MAPAAATASKPVSAARNVSVDVDLVRSYLRDIGRVPLLTHEQEITLGRQVQDLMDIEALQTELESRDGDKPSADKLAKASGLTSLQLKRKLQHGRRAKERMVAANLRLVVSVAKKYTKRNMELLDLIQEGTIGLVRGVEKFDPTRGYKFSTYAFWWIRQSMTRAIACQSRTIRLPVHLSERLATIRKATMDLAHKLGAMPSRKEIATELGMDIDELDGLLRQALTTSSLDAPISGEEGRSFLGELIADSRNEEPLDAVERRMHHEQLGRWLSYLTEQEKQVLELRFGLGGEQRHTLAEIGRLMDVSRERVRQVELKALRKLRNLTRRVPTQL